MSTVPEPAALDPDAPGPKAHRSPWIWVSALLAVAAIGLLVWGLGAKSDEDSASKKLASTQQQLSSTEDELATTNAELDKAKKEAEAAEAAKTADRRRRIGGAVVAAGGLAAGKAVYDDLTGELGATQEDLATTQDDLDTATKEADAAAADAKAAEQEASKAGDETDKAKAETAQAKAETQAEKAKGTVLKECVNAYVSAFGGLFEGDSVRDQAADVRKQLSGVTEDCRGALDGA